MSVIFCSCNKILIEDISVPLLNIHHAYMFRPNWSSSGHLQDTKVLKCV
jgi:hypothetical protein